MLTWHRAEQCGRVYLHCRWHAHTVMGLLHGLALLRRCVAVVIVLGVALVPAGIVRVGQQLVQALILPLQARVLLRQAGLLRRRPLPSGLPARRARRRPAARPRRGAGRGVPAWRRDADPREFPRKARPMCIFGPTKSVVITVYECCACAWPLAARVAAVSRTSTCCRSLGRRRSRRWSSARLRSGSW